MTQTKKLRLTAFLTLAGMFFCLAAPHAMAAEVKSINTTTSSEDTALDDGGKCSNIITETVSYQVGGKEIKVSRSELEVYQHPSHAGDLYTYNWVTYDTYTFSQPLRAVNRSGEWNVVIDVPAGTSVTRMSRYENQWHDGTGDGESADDDSPMELEWIVTKHVYTREEGLPEKLAGGEDVRQIKSGQSLTVANGTQYQLVMTTDDGVTQAAGGLVFRGV